MKKFFILTFTCLIAFTGYSQKNGYKIKVKVNGIKDTVCYLANYFGDKPYLQDTAKVDSKGNMVFSKKKKLPEGIYLVILPKKNYFEFIMTDNPYFSLDTDTANLVKSMKIKGSQENVDFYEYIKFIANQSKAMDSLKKVLAKTKNKQDSILIKEKTKAIDKSVEAYKSNYILKHKNELFCKVLKAQNEIDIPKPPVKANGNIDSNFQYLYWKAHYFDNIDLTDERLIRTPIYHAKLDYFFKSVVLQMPDSINKEADLLIDKLNKTGDLFKYTVFYLTSSFERSQVMGLDAVFVHEIEKYYKTNQAFWVDSASLSKVIKRADILKPLLIGKVAPLLVLQDTTEANVANYQLNNKFIIQIFWEPSCGHCQKEVPKLHDEYLKMKKAGYDIEVYAICISYDKKEWKKFIREKNLDWVNVMDMTPRYLFKELYDIYSTPVVYILNNKKEIIAKRIGVEQIEDFLKNYSKRKK